MAARSGDAPLKREAGQHANHAKGGRALGASVPVATIDSGPFRTFYKEQPIAELDALIAALESPLPQCFRINSMSPLAPRLLAEMPKWGAKVRELSWYPGRYAWQVDGDRKSLRKSPEHHIFHRWLVSLSDRGHLVRQEAASMLPAVLLDVGPDHMVLDMCAAPGSKTTQLIEALHCQGQVRFPTGLVVANDASQSRARRLVAHCRSHPSVAIVTTWHKAEFFPHFGAFGGFDRILCDVPCSGDATLRKNVNGWSQWSPSSALELHPVQLQIAQRALALLKVSAHTPFRLPTRAHAGAYVDQTCALDGLACSELRWAAGWSTRRAVSTRSRTKPSYVHCSTGRATRSKSRVSRAGLTNSG